MAINSKIEWTESTWNPVTGCNKVSPGCKNCYAEKMALRLKAMRQSNYSNGFNVTMHFHAVELPLSWRKPQTIFVNSMSDLFHDKIPLEFIQNVFNVMNKAHWHTFQVLTKRSKRLNEVSNQLTWTKNIWMGVSVETDKYVHRVYDLIKTDAYIKFLSLEPLLGPIPSLKLDGIDWVIVGGESGLHARIIKEDWVLDIKDKCEKENVPFFFKQWGGINKKKNGRILLGQPWNALPIKFVNDSSHLHFA